MAASTLESGEKPTLQNEVRSYYRNEHQSLDSGKLFLTNRNRIVFVHKTGVFGKKYTIIHGYPIKWVTAAKSDKADGALNIYVNWQGKERVKYRYIGFNIGSLATKINSMSQAIVQANEKLIKQLNSKEHVTLLEAQKLLQDMTSLPYSMDEVTDMIRTWITNKSVDGIIDDEKKEFVHRIAYRQKTK